jgi:hypothetical protein
LSIRILHHSNRIAREKTIYWFFPYYESVESGIAGSVHELPAEEAAVLAFLQE